MKLNGKVAWVVDASSGIGAAVARELASRGGPRRRQRAPRRRRRLSTRPVALAAAALGRVTAASGSAPALLTWHEE